MRGEWIEIDMHVAAYARNRSLPMRGEWIEIIWPSPPLKLNHVSPHAGRVD